MFNELERRQTHLCNLVNGISCQSTPLSPVNQNPLYRFYGLIKEIAFVPLPKQSH